MQCALQEAEKAFVQDEVPVGAIIVEASSRKIIARAHNEMVRAQDPTAHAEMLAIRRALVEMGEDRLRNCDLYVTLEPCPMCAQAISFARIRRLYFGAYDLKGGGVDHGAKIFNAPSCHHVPEIMGGLEQEKCAALLKDFFEKKREDG